MVGSERSALVVAAGGPLAQLAEQQTLNLRVRGSIPRRLTNLLPARKWRNWQTRWI